MKEQQIMSPEDIHALVLQTAQKTIDNW
jgi:hypothetical protein